ncbi:MAG TPA: alpha/beta hydrolase [Jatrophihabitans sp.]|nr:alpha/beta hydrolase [Jatrophihabitans sp.]
MTQVAGSLLSTRTTWVRGAGNVEIACWRTGHGRPLVLVHGTGDDHSRWSPLIERLAEVFQVWAIDRRGRGGSGDAERYTLGDEAADLAAVAARAGDAIMIGHSYGAICALEAAAETSHIGPLVLFEPPIRVEATAATAAAWVDRIHDLAEAGQHEEAVCVFLRDVVRLPDQQIRLLRQLPGFGQRAAGLVRTVAREAAAALDYMPQSARLRRVRGPVLLLVGEHSPPDLRLGTEAVNALLANARIELLPGQSHHAIDSGPGLLEAILRFLPTAEPGEVPGR